MYSVEILSLRFSVKTILTSLDAQNCPFWQLSGALNFDLGDFQHFNLEQLHKNQNSEPLKWSKSQYLGFMNYHFWFYVKSEWQKNYVWTCTVWGNSWVTGVTWWPISFQLFCLTHVLISRSVLKNISKNSCRKKKNLWMNESYNWKKLEWCWIGFYKRKFCEWMVTIYSKKYVVKSI